MISKYANNSLASSKISQAALPATLKTTKNRQPVSESMAVSAHNNHDTNVTVLGINFKGFLAPALISGRQAKTSHEIVVDRSNSWPKQRSAPCYSDSVTADQEQPCLDW